MAARLERTARISGALSVAVIATTCAVVHAATMFDPEQVRFSQLNTDDGLSSAVVYSIVQDPTGFMWFATDAGLDRYDGYELQGLTEDPGSDRSSGVGDVADVLLDSTGTMWIATADGLNVFDPESGGSVRYDERHGLPSASVHAVLEDDLGHLWVATGHGLCRLDPATGTVRAYTIDDGLPSNSFSDGACCTGRDGRMYFGGPSGYCSLRPEPMLEDPSGPPVVLCSFRRFDQPLDFDRPAHQVDEIELSYRDNFFSVKFAALDFRNPARNTYRYILEGFDRRWNHAGNHRVGTYTNVDPGRYVFRVQASNRNGVWNREGLSVTIRVIPPLWQTWWFRLAAVAMVVLSLVTWSQLKLAAPAGASASSSTRWTFVPPISPRPTGGTPTRMCASSSSAEPTPSPASATAGSWRRDSRWRWPFSRARANGRAARAGRPPAGSASSWSTSTASRGSTTATAMTPATPT